MTKIDRLLALLRAGHSVTRVTALATVKLANPTAAITTLRSRGHVINTVTADDGSGDGTTYTKWVYVRAKPGTPAARNARPVAGTYKGGKKGGGKKG